MEDAPPPTKHVLRPHHVGLLTLFMLFFKEYEPKNLPSPFVLHVYRILLNEVSETSQTKSHGELLRELASGPKADAEEPSGLISTLREAHQDLQTPDQMTNFFHSIPVLFLEKNDDEEPTILTRRSIFGYFCRRCFVSFVKLSFSGVVKIQKDYLSWCQGNDKAGYEPIDKDQLDDGDKLIFKTQADTKIWAQPEAFTAWEKGNLTGDENVATENLRRFFEQHFHESNDSGIRQHALLNLVRMHYIRHEYMAVRKLLQEAIIVARTSGDRIILQHCMSMLHRLPPTEKGRKDMLNEIQPDLHPLEILFDVNKLMKAENGQPLSSSFEKITQAMGLYDQWLDKGCVSPVESEQWGQHIVQGIVWNAAGVSRLAAIQENIVTAFTDVHSNDNNRITVTLNRAYRLARQGKYDCGLATLLDPNVWRGIMLDDYLLWANQIWHVLVLKTSRRGQDRVYREFLLPRRSFFPYNPKDYFFNTELGTLSLIRNELYEVMQMKKCSQSIAAVEELLKALWHSEFQGRMDLYRIGVVLLADISLEFGVTDRSQKILEEIMPQVINGDNLELRAMGCFVFSRCIIAAGTPTAETWQKSLFYLLISEKDYTELQMLQPLTDVQYLLSIVYHNLDQETARDEAIRRHFGMNKRLKELEIHIDEEVREIWQVVTQVGAFLAVR